MTKQILASIKQKASDKRVILSVGIVFAISLPIRAQGTQDSFLPPEVIPVSHAISYGSAPKGNSINSALVGSNQASAMTAQNIAAPGMNSQAMQTPQEARQALYHSLMGNNIYPQFNGQQNNLAGNMDASQSLNPTQAYNEGNAQTLNNQTQPAANMQMAQNNMPNNPSPSQSQTLSGGLATQAASQQNKTAGFSKLAGLTAGLGQSGVALAGMRSPGGIYSAGLLGAGILNYGLRSGLKF